MKKSRVTLTAAEREELERLLARGKAIGGIRPPLGRRAGGPSPPPPSQPWQGCESPARGLGRPSARLIRLAPEPCCVSPPSGRRPRPASHHRPSG